MYGEPVETRIPMFSTLLRSISVLEKRWVTKGNKKLHRSKLYYLRDRNPNGVSSSFRKLCKDFLLRASLIFPCKYFYSHREQCFPVHVQKEKEVNRTQPMIAKYVVTGNIAKNFRRLDV